LLVWNSAFRRLERLAPAEAGTPNCQRFQCPNVSGSNERGLSINPLLTTPAIGTGNPSPGASSLLPDGPGVGSASECPSKRSTALDLNRRQFIRASGAALAAAVLTARLEAGYTKLKIGAPDWNLKLEAKPA